MPLEVTEEHVGKIVAGKHREFAHTIWADKAEAIWKFMEDYKGLLIHDVGKNLPEGILNCISDPKTTRDDYKAFLQSIRDISIDNAI